MPSDGSIITNFVAGGVNVVIVKFFTFESPASGLGLVTITLAAPAEEISKEEIIAVSWLELINVVSLTTPFHFTTDPETNFVPFTVKTKLAPPASREDGAIEIIERIELSVTVNIY